MEKAEVFKIMKEKGYSRIEVEYSGGGDEGGVDEIRVYDMEDKLLEDVEIEEPYIHSTYDAKKRDWIPDRAMTRDEEFASALVEPVDDEYGSFAGDFDCYGIVYWNAITEKVVMEDNIKSDYDHRTLEL